MKRPNKEEFEVIMHSRSFRWCWQIVCSYDIHEKDFFGLFFLEKKIMKIEQMLTTKSYNR